MKIEKNERLTQLCGLYGIRLTDIQQQYFSDYYFADLSLAEIAENSSVSRQAIFDNLKRTVKLLEDYEAKLKLAAHFTQIDEGLDVVLAKLEQHELESATTEVRKIKKIIEEN